MNFKKIIAELKRRNVFKVATVYGITGWLIIQIITSISEPLSLPDWRSEERRVGKECRVGWWTNHEKKKSRR